MVNEKQENLIEDQQNEDKIVPFVDSANTMNI